MPKFKRKGSVLEVSTLAAGDSEPETFAWASKFRRDFERGYRKFWAKRGIDAAVF